MPRGTCSSKRRSSTPSIARTARRHKLPSEASRRFERGVDPLIPFVAARRVADLMVELAGGTLDAELGGALYGEVFVASIELPRAFVPALIGVDYTDAEITGALETIGCEVTALPDADAGWEVIPPSWRPDLTDRCGRSPKRWRASTGSTASRRCCRPRTASAPDAASRRCRRGVAVSRTRSPPPGSSRRRRSRSRPRRRTTCTGRRRASTSSRCARQPARRSGAVPAPLARAGAPAGRAPQPLPRVHRPRPVQTGPSVFTPEPGWPTAPTRCRRSRTSERRDPGGPDLRDPAAAASCRGAADGERRAQAPRTRARRRRPRRRAVGRRGDRRGGGRAHRGGAGGARGAPPRPHGRAVGGGRRGRLRRRAAARRVGGGGPAGPGVRGRARPRRRPVARPDAGGRGALSGFPAATQDVSLVVGDDVVAGDVRAALVEGAGELLESVRLVDDYRGQGLEAGQKSSRSRCASGPTTAR